MPEVSRPGHSGARSGRRRVVRAPADEGVRAVEPNPRVTFGVRFEDDDLVVVDKPARLVSTPGVGHEDDTLLNGLMARYGERLGRLGAGRGFGLVHRLDRDTSGLVVAALSRHAYDALRAGFAGREVAKFYWAVVRGAPTREAGVIRKPLVEVLRRDSAYTSARIARVSGSGRPALTAYRTLGAGASASLIECRPVTGRLHQVRVHLASIGCPVLGDDEYAPGGVRDASPRLALHAHRLRLRHPRTGEPLDVRSPCPRDLRALCRRLGLTPPGSPRSSG